MGKFHSLEMKKQILEEYHNSNMSSIQLGEKYNISPNTILTWHRKYRQGIDVLTPDQRAIKSGKQLKENRDDDKQRIEILKKLQKYIKSQQE